MSSGFFVCINGQVDACKIVGVDNVYVKYTFNKGHDWQLMSGVDGGISQIARQSSRLGSSSFYDAMLLGAGGSGSSSLSDNIFILNYPVEVIYRSSNVYGWPQMVFAVYSLSRYGGNDVIVGYAALHVPCTPGRHVRYARLYTPVSSSLWQRFMSYLTNNPPEFFDPKFVAQGKGREVTRVRSKGVVKVTFNILTKNMAESGYTVTADRPLHVDSWQTHTQQPMYQSLTATTQPQPQQQQQQQRIDEEKKQPTNISLSQSIQQALERNERNERRVNALTALRANANNLQNVQQTATVTSTTTTTTSSSAFHAASASSMTSSTAASAAPSSAALTAPLPLPPVSTPISFFDRFRARKSPLLNPTTPPLPPGDDKKDLQPTLPAAHSQSLSLAPPPQSAQPPNATFSPSDQSRIDSTAAGAAALSPASTHNLSLGSSTTPGGSSLSSRFFAFGRNLFGANKSTVGLADLERKEKDKESRPLLQHSQADDKQTEQIASPAANAVHMAQSVPGIIAATRVVDTTQVASTGNATGSATVNAADGQIELPTLRPLSDAT